MDIKEILGKEYLDKFRIFHPTTLFPPFWDALLKTCCPLCFNKLKLSEQKRIFYCNGIKHPKPFIISINRLRDIKTKY